MRKRAMAAVLAASLGIPAAAAARQAADTTMPVIVKEVKPDYPADAKREKRQGSVMLAVMVNADGSVGDVRVKQPLSPKLDASAVKAMKQWRFKPATRNGKPVPVETDVEMTFTLR